MVFTKYSMRAVSLLLGMGAIFSAYRLRWVCDDAFISFRYARNLARGLGLVYNAGERVEGYTNFLWTLMMAPAEYFFLDIVSYAMMLNLIFYAGAFLCIYFISTRLHLKNKFGYALPIAIGIFSFHRHARIYATSGLETPLYVFLILLGTAFIFWTSRETDEPNRKDGLFTSLAMLTFALAVLTRPDGIVFYATASLYFFFSGNFSLRYVRSSNTGKWIGAQAKLHWPLFAIIIPYWVGRYLYYGYAFPNTYYAKSGGEASYQQGLAYFKLYFNSYYVFYLVPILSIVYVAMKIRGKINSLDMRPLILLLLPALILIFYYVRAGGGFMFARFFIPATPLLALLVEWMIGLIEFRRIAALIGILAIGATIAFRDPYKGEKLPIRDGITDEHKIYPLATVRRFQKFATGMKATFHRSRARIAVGGTQALMAYYLDTGYVLEAAGGLTDAVLAHKKVTRKGRRPGHAKSATIDDMILRGVHLHLNSSEIPGKRSYNIISVQNPIGEWRILRYDVAVMEAFSGHPNLKFTPFPSFLDDYLLRMVKMKKKQVRSDYAEFRKYYFLHTPDKNRENAMRKFLGLQTL